MAGLIVVLAVVLLAQADALAVEAQLSPPPAGMARVWILRQYQPYESPTQAMVYVNSLPLASSQTGTVFFRDFPPGTYTFTVESYGVDYDQAQTLQLMPGMQVYLEIQSLSSWSSYRNFKRDTFYVRMIPPERAWQYLPQMGYLGAR